MDLLSPRRQKGEEGHKRQGDVIEREKGDAYKTSNGTHLVEAFQLLKRVHGLLAPGTPFTHLR